MSREKSTYAANVANLLRMVADSDGDETLKGVVEIKLPDLLRVAADELDELDDRLHVSRLEMRHAREAIARLEKERDELADFKARRCGDVGPGMPCPCGSGKRFKDCCLSIPQCCR